MKIFLFILIFFSTNKLCSQTIECYNQIDFYNFDNLLIVVNDYNNITKSKESVILVDYYINENNIDYFRISWDLNILEVLYKVPSCYILLDSMPIIYLYTNKYDNISDTTWINRVLNRTIFSINMADIQYDFDIEINWSNDTIFFNNFDFYFPALEYNPLIFEYKIINGEIYDKKYCNEMYYPYLIINEKINKQYIDFIKSNNKK